jgi:stage III sporulation protein AG
MEKKMTETAPGPWVRIMKFLRKENNIQMAIIGVAAVALIIFICTTISWPGSGQPSNANSSGAAANSGAAQESLETQLEGILSQVANAGAVKVLVTYETGPEIVPALKTDTQSNSSDGAGAAGQGNSTTSITENKEPVTVQGKNGTEPMVLVQKEPVVLGVLVVAEGASDLEVRLNLLQAVQVALQIPSDRIEILPMK